MLSNLVLNWSFIVCVPKEQALIAIKHTDHSKTAACGKSSATFSSGITTGSSFPHVLNTAYNISQPTSFIHQECKQVSMAF